MSLGIVPIKVRIFILGLSPFAQELRYYLADYVSGGSALRPDSVIELVDPSDETAVKAYHNAVSSTSERCYSIIGSDDAETRFDYSKLMIAPLKFTHYRSFIANSVSTEQGSIVFPGALIAPNAVLKANSFCHMGSSVGFGSQIGECSVVGPRACLKASVIVGDRVQIGAGAVVEENLLIGSGVRIAPGEVVTQDRVGDTNG